MTRHGVLQSLGDEEDPQNEPCGQREKEREVKLADRPHHLVVDPHEQEQIGDADTGQDQRCRRDHPCRCEQQEAGGPCIHLRLKAARGDECEQGYDKQPKDQIETGTPAQSLRAGLFYDQRNAACHSSEEKVEHRHGISLDEPEQRIGKDQDPEYAAEGEDDEEGQVLLLVLGERADC